jgi:phosphoserine phosphatase RsbU/P
MIKKSSSLPQINNPDSIESNSIDFNALFEFSNLLNSSLDIQFILDHILLSSMGKMLLTKGCIILLKSANIYSVRSVKGISLDQYGTEIKITECPPDIFFIDKMDFKKYKWLKHFSDIDLKISIPVTSKDKTLGIIFFGEKFTHKDFDANDTFFLKAISNIASTSIDNSLIVQDLQKANRDLDKKIQQLNTLFDIGKEFVMLFEEDKIIRLLSFSLMGQMGIKNYAVLIKKNGVLNINLSKIPYIEQYTDLLQGLLSINHPGYLDSFKQKGLRHCIKMLKGLNVEIIIPMQSSGEIKGILLLSDRINHEEYSTTDIEFISALSNTAVLSMENARLFKETLEKQRLEEEILIAREIQQGLLPKSLPVITEYDTAAINISSKQVGGDYYEILPLNENEFIIAIADVSGKGVPASLLMAYIQATIRALASSNEPLTEKTGKINNIIFENTSTSKFITFFWGVLNKTDHSFTYVNAGHNPPILLHNDGSYELLEAGGVILGVMPTVIPYESGAITINPNDSLFLYTDGVTESMDKVQNEFGENKLLEILKNKFPASSQETIDTIICALEKHSEGCGQYDDITMISVKRSATI